MLSPSLTRPTRVLMTCDAVGGVWRYCLDAAESLNRAGISVLLAGLGPAPSKAKREAVAALPDTRLAWLDAPLDWMAEGPRALDGVGREVERLARQFGAELLHLNLPSQAVELDAELPTVVVSHSCPVTWWRAMRDTALPREWDWLRVLTRAGFDRAGVVLAPSRAHGEALVSAYGPIDGLRVLHNATRPSHAARRRREPFVLAAGRWWDESKDMATLDAMALEIDRPVVAAGALVAPDGQQRVQPPRHVDSLGEVPPEMLADLMDRAAVFVSPSRYEPFGLAPLEAALRGAALVLADTPTYRELWEGAARFAPPRDACAFAAAVRELDENPDARAALAAAGRERARHYSLERQHLGLVEAYAAARRHARTRRTQALPPLSARSAI